MDTAAVFLKPAGSVPFSGPGDVPTGIVPVSRSPRADDIGMAPVGARRRSAGPSRGLRAAVFMTATAAIGVAIAIVVLGIQPTSPGGPPASASPAAPGPPPGLTTTSSNSANVAVGSAPYRIQFLAAGPCWVQVTSGSRTLFAGTLQPGQGRQFDLQGPARVELGSTGGRLALTYWGHAFNLVPPGAPYTYTFS